MAAELNPAPVVQRQASLHEGEPCGDAALHLILPGPAGAPPVHLLAIIDGLGHGAEAALAAQAALAVIAEHAALPLAALFAQLDQGMMGSRGAAIGLARIQGRHLQHAAVGNTRALCWDGSRSLRLPSQYGIVGAGLRQPVMVNEWRLHEADWLLLFTDGLDERLSLGLRLPEWTREPDLLCEHLMAHWRKTPDDACVLVWTPGA